MDLAKHIGTRARAARTALGLTQAEVSEDAGLSEEVYGRLERGGMLPSVPTLVRLCTTLKVTPNDLLTESAPTRPKKHRAEITRIVRQLERADDKLLSQVLVVIRAMIGNGPKPATGRPRK